MGVISNKEIEQLANLSRLTFTEEEKAVYAQEMNVIIEFAKKLEEVDTTGIEPTIQLVDHENVLREDKVRPSLPVEEVMKNVPEHVDNQVKVPSIIED